MKSLVNVLLYIKSIKKALKMDGKNVKPRVNVLLYFLVPN